MSECRRGKRGEWQIVVGYNPDPGPGWIGPLLIELVTE
jgi:hypothetical protein